MKKGLLQNYRLVLFSDHILVLDAIEISKNQDNKPFDTIAIALVFGIALPENKETTNFKFYNPYVVGRPL